MLLLILSPKKFVGQHVVVVQDPSVVSQDTCRDIWDIKDTVVRHCITFSDLCFFHMKYWIVPHSSGL